VKKKRKKETQESGGHLKKEELGEGFSARFIFDEC
jgi:hypothetical protein